MNNLIIYAHPSPNSFSNAIMNTIIELSIKNGHKIEVRDLYYINFNPVLKDCDFMGAKENRIPQEIKREQEYLRWANVITFIYPIWWLGMPAIVKGYIDRVFFHDLIFNYKSQQSEQMLMKKKVIILNPMGTSNESYEKDEMLKAMKNTCDMGIFQFCGMEVIDHKFFGDIKTGDKEKRKAYLEEVEETFLKIMKDSK
jgi:NAD(P)H dehydrogenase (quinone)